MIKVTGLAFAHKERPLFKEVNFIVGNGQKVGLVGPNGAGKTTLLNLLLQNETPQFGKIETSGTMALVPQEVKRDPIMENSKTVKDYVDPENKYAKHELMKLFAGLELSVSLTAQPNNLSGGQKTKLALARALLLKPDVLLLDEPTNFMDLPGKKWVMNFISSYPNTVILISHDLKLMDRAINKVLAINPATTSIEEYKGNYSNFVRLKKEKEELEKRQFIIKQKHIKQMEEGLKKMQRFTSTKGVRARVRQQRRIEKEKAALPDLPREVRRIKVNLPDPAPVGELPVRAINISKSFDDKQVLESFNFKIERGERVALIGPNGTGKSTLIKILMERLKPDSGEVIANQSLKAGYYSQEFETFDMQKTVLDTFVENTKKEEGFARSFLGRYMFMGDKVFQRVESLSGGEKTRLSIALLTGHDYNLLVLDEPTTYLDVLSQRVILDALKEYKGAMIVVSHTPEFIGELNPSRAYLFPEGKMVYWDEELLAKTSET